MNCNKIVGKDFEFRRFFIKQYLSMKYHIFHILSRLWAGN